MKKLFQISAILVGILMAQFAYSQDFAVGGDEGACCPQERPTGQCYCLYCKYEPCYSNCWRCCEENRYYQKCCCRQVPCYYQVQRCRYVPQYYCETCCKYKPEYYYVTECRPCKKWVCDKKCNWVPKYYWKYTCQPTADNCCVDQGSPSFSGPVSQPSCGPQGCGR